MLHVYALEVKLKINMFRNTAKILQIKPADVE